MSHQSKAIMAALASEERVTKHVRHKCFISYHHADDEEVAAFINEFSDVFIAKVLGVSDSDDDLIAFPNRIGSKAEPGSAVRCARCRSRGR